ncbi:DUF4835 family protein [Mucilaginibacter sp. HMF5004]|uniref:type IX secretion system protein PorD n=1 Tax=Mucilaginibacter rivuli TaxID=2857527 RepID=UPI001C5D5C1E|nr:DUF4835 family protein [Mucilaginibacter rivuli]MBW4890563.1 DUF4835 family protein [Mucilaginibacter rivuli]
MKRIICCLFILLTTVVITSAQDLNARVQVLSPKIQSSNKRVFTVLETSIKNFLNNRKWSADQILAQEKINCNFIINITSWDGSSAYSAELQVQSTRPVYGAGYNSTLLSINDKDFDFTYTEGQNLDFNEQIFQNNLSSVLAFYANVIVGMDYDSFSKFGGTPYFAKAQTIVNAAQTGSAKGWNAFDNNRDRYWVSENLNNKRYVPLREFIYIYHRNGLDAMADNADNARKAIAAALPGLSQIDRQSTGVVLPQILFTAKSDELISIFSAMSLQDRVKIYNTLMEIDPSNGNKYQSLQSN